MVVRGDYDTSSFVLPDASVSTAETEGATIRFGKLRFRRAAVVVNSGNGPCHAVLYVRAGQRWESLKAGWIRGNTDVGGAGDALRWKGELVTEVSSGVWARIRNDTGAAVTVGLSYWGDLPV